MAEQKFRVQSGIVFPDGTEQTTAYTGTTEVSEFVLINSDGGVYGSNDGETWSGPFDSGLVSLRRVAVGPNIVVYIGGTNTEDGDDNNLHYTTVWNVTPTIVLDEGPANWRQVRYFSGIGRFVAVGSIDGTAAYKHSSDGVTWVTVYVDTVWSATLAEGVGSGPAAFTDVATNGFGFMLTTDNTVLGSFYTTTLTSNSSIGESAWLNDGMDFREVVYSSAGDFTGWFAFGIGGDVADGWWYNGAFDPGNDSFALFLGLIGESFVGDVGYQPTWSELVIGRYNGIDTIVIATSDGQIAYWPAVPAGPFVSIPKPFFTSITGITSASPAVLSYLEHSHANNEKIIITDCGDFNGTFYINVNNELFTDSAMTVPFDATLLTYTSGGTVTFSHGMYIDALNYANSNFYVANDSEEVFVSTDGGATWTEVASLNSGGTPGGEGGDGPGTGTQYMNDIDGFVGTVGITADTGDITFEGVKIIGAQGGEREGLISLVPAKTGTVGLDSWNFEDYGQFINIYPTNAFDVPHIHIAAGSGPDSTGDLMLGDDNTYVEINHNGYVGIESYNSDTSDYHYWQFGTDGKFSAPGEVYGNFFTLRGGQTLGDSIGTLGYGGDIIVLNGFNGVKIESGAPEEGSIWEFGTDGSLLVPGNIKSESNIDIEINLSDSTLHRWQFGEDGSTTLPGALVSATDSPVQGTFPVGAATAITVTNSPNVNWTNGTGVFANGIGFGVFVDGSGNATVVVSDGGTGHYIGETFGPVVGTTFGGTSPADDMYFEVTAIAPGSVTALDLTKQTQILTAVGSAGAYSLADGAEGQIMYFVPSSGVNDGIYVNIANARIMGEGPTDVTDYSWTPFSGELLAPTTIAMAIFADGAWCLRGGATD